MPREPITLRARYVFPVDGPPIPNGTVRVAGERISDVGPGDRQPDVDLGNAAVVPGFVNAHTHLELSNLRAKSLGGGDFADWLRRVVQARRGQHATEVLHAVQRGIDASLAAGTTLIGDISTGGRSWQALSRSPLRATVFCELVGLQQSRAAETARAARQFLEWAGYCMTGPAGASVAEVDECATPASGLAWTDGTTLGLLPHTRAAPLRSRLRASLSPHAPYSTHPKLFDLAAEWGGHTGEVLCTHLAETREELRLLEHCDGPLRQFLDSIGAWDDGWNPAGASPLDYLRTPIADRADWLIAHGNFIGEADIAQLAASPRRGSLPTDRRVAIAFCPRTHAFFAHPKHPYRTLLGADLTVCLGTDSLASTPTLSILDEMRFLHGRDQSLPGATLLHMATLAGARALRREEVCGSLAAGKFADLAVIRLPDRDDDDPYRLLLESDGPVIQTMIGGRIAFQMR